MAQNQKHGTIADLIQAAELVMALENKYLNSVSSSPPPPSNTKSNISDVTAQHSNDSSNNLCSYFPPNEAFYQKNNSIFCEDISCSSGSLPRPFSPTLDRYKQSAQPQSQLQFQYEDPTLCGHDHEFSSPYGACPNQSYYASTRRECYIDKNMFKPPFSYAQLIIQAISSSESGKMALSNIYKYILRKYKFYDIADKGWQNSIRHNLSLNKYFVKLPRRNEETGKGSYWIIDPEKKDQLIAQAFKVRKQRNVPLLRMSGPMYGKHYCPCFQCDNSSYEENDYNNLSSSTSYPHSNPSYNSSYNSYGDVGDGSDHLNSVVYYGRNNEPNSNLIHNTNKTQLITRSKRSYTDSYIDQYKNSEINPSNCTTPYKTLPNDNEPLSYDFYESVYNKASSVDDSETPYHQSNFNPAEAIGPSQQFNT